MNRDGGWWEGRGGEGREVKEQSRERTETETERVIGELMWEDCGVGFRRNKLS